MELPTSKLLTQFSALLLASFSISNFSSFGNSFSAQWEEVPEANEDHSLMTLQEVIDEKAIPVKKESQTAWRAVGASCLILEESESIEEGKDLYDWNPETDEKTLLISAEKFIPPGREKPLKLEYQKNLIWSPDEKKLREGLSRGVDLQ